MKKQGKWRREGWKDISKERMKVMKDIRIWYIRNKIMKIGKKRNRKRKDIRKERIFGLLTEWERELKRVKEMKDISKETMKARNKRKNIEKKIKSIMTE